MKVVFSQKGNGLNQLRFRYKITTGTEDQLRALCLGEVGRVEDLVDLLQRRVFGTLDPGGAVVLVAAAAWRQLLRCGSEEGGV